MEVFSAAQSNDDEAVESFIDGVPPNPQIRTHLRCLSPSRMTADVAQASQRRTRAKLFTATSVLFSTTRQQPQPTCSAASVLMSSTPCANISHTSFAPANEHRIQFATPIT
jgi:hypothetical protein